MVARIYPTELQLKQFYASETDAQFLDLHLSISKGFISSKFYNKRDDFDFDKVFFSFFFLMGKFSVLPLTVFTFLKTYSIC